uniref:Uncharacterized protein n=1 Tax=Anguilla anguilla TaxID=7936 RepID=A0A0E9SX93_ANGAN
MEREYLKLTVFLSALCAGKIRRSARLLLFIYV